MIGVSFASDWLRECCKFSEPITEQSKAKPMQHQITFNIHISYYAINFNLYIGILLYNENKQG